MHEKKPCTMRGKRGDDSPPPPPPYAHMRVHRRARERGGWKSLLLSSSPYTRVQEEVEEKAYARRKSIR